MAAPTPYTLAYDFTAFQVANPTMPLPADKIEIEYGAIALTTSEIITNLGLIQRSDGALMNGSVSFDALSNDVKALLGSSILPRGAWVTATSYAVLDLIDKDGSSYICAVVHTSGVFATDVAAGKWVIWTAGADAVINNNNWSGADLTVPNGGTGVSTLTGLVKGNGTSAFSAATAGTDYYAPGSTDVAVVDGGTGASTAGGARTNLGLGSMAVQDANAVAITGGSVAGITDIAVADGGTGASNVVDARTNLGITDNILQHLRTAKDDTFSTTSTTFADVTGLSQAITLSNTGHKVRGNFTVGAGASVGNFVMFRIVRDSTAINVGASAGSRQQATVYLGLMDNEAMQNAHFEFEDSPGDTSAHTYKLQMLTSGGTGYLNRTPTDTNSAVYGRTISQITVQECRT